MTGKFMTLVMPRSRGVTIGLVGAVLLGCNAQPAGATWSIIIIDTRTKEMAVGSATCLTGFDLRKDLPVVLVDIGAACAQSYVDMTGANRRRIWDQFLAGTEPEEILALLEAFDPGHYTRQYGIVDARGRAVTFTGDGAGSYADGVVGTVGTLVYAIQGNVITGAPVIAMVEQAVRNTEGGLPEKLMAAMEAARAMGGDGRCSCDPANPTQCGSPPKEFEKSAHVGFMIVTRSGDRDGSCGPGAGCANGDYYLNLNVPYQSDSDPDPVVQLQEMFDAWQESLDGRPDAVHSTVTVDPPVIHGYAPSLATMTITVRDHHGILLTAGGFSVSVGHDDDSAHVTAIGAPVDLGGGVYQVTLTGQPGGGFDRFRVTLDDSIRPVVVMPIPTLLNIAKPDLDEDGDVDGDDYRAFFGCLLGPGKDSGEPACAGSDFDEDHDSDLADFARMQREFASGPCNFLRITVPPEWLNVACGGEVWLSVEAEGEPPPTYQWSVRTKQQGPSGEGTPIPGAVGPTYHIESVGEDDRGWYSCRAANSCGTVQSEIVWLRLFPLPCD